MLIEMDLITALWRKLKAACLHSLTVAWTYCLAIIGAALQAIDAIADAFSDPDLKAQIGAAIGDAQTVGRILLGVAVITMIARLRSLRKSA
jgi:hypothetical protein